ncbi:tripartite ATP-independent transporter DctM subunit [Halanaerobium saccharolyticum]|uniref:Tripartite ATP-independent transporter DctM subunit n=1 Tax=Halanaerobium saccharolyticum TaxID=43595 RepID=A0A4R6LZ73_9FIRM|nr:TRAP transporter large permease [Halanaerobium saccharolyticum]TDO94197.1 tripartite ATP-independent transporter DctM subunit [Halanaerobium saccharolyticum]
MEPAIIILLGSFFLLIFLNVPIAFAMGISSVLTSYYLDIQLIMVFQRMISGLRTFTFLAVPFFILVGLIMGNSGISEKIIKFASLFIGRIKGGLAMVNVLASMLFGGISGSSSADVSSIGALLIPLMQEEGYDDDFSVAVTTTSSVQGVIIPPSQNIIYYSLAAGGLSVGRLFIAGYIPGITLGIFLMVLCYILARKRDYPTGETIALKEVPKVVFDSFLGLFTIIIIIGGIVAGVFTATESAAVAVVYVLFLSLFVYKSLTIKDIIKIFNQSIGTLSMIIAIISTSSAFAWLLAYLNIPQLLLNSLLGITENRIILLLLINVILLFLGMIMDMGIIILLITPILLPIVVQLGMNPIQFGIMMMLNLGIGLNTPPVGTSLYIGCAIAGIKIEETLKILVPFYIVMGAVLLLTTFWPEFTLYLPDLIF